MIIQWQGKENFIIKTKALTVSIGEKNKLGDLEIKGPGEYEIGGVQLEIIDGISEVFAEGMVVGHIKKGKVFTDEELEKLNNINILLVGIGGGKFTETKVAQEMINQIEPGIVIPMYENNLEEFTKESSDSFQDEIKIVRGELPEDERKVVVLNARS